MSNPVEVALDHLAVYRVARREWPCTCAVPGSNNASGAAPDCRAVIHPGDRYVEYLGEAGGYRSGTRYCLPCGLKSWAT